MKRSMLLFFNTNAVHCINSSETKWENQYSPKNCCTIHCNALQNAQNSTVSINNITCEFSGGCAPRHQEGWSNNQQQKHDEVRIEKGSSGVSRRKSHQTVSNFLLLVIQSAFTLVNENLHVQKTFLIWRSFMVTSILGF
jgi:hypothetical protein